MLRDEVQQVREIALEISKDATSRAVNALSAVLAGLEARIKRLETADTVELPRSKKNNHKPDALEG